MKTSSSNDLGPDSSARHRRLLRYRLPSPWRQPIRRPPSDCPPSRDRRGRSPGASDDWQPKELVWDANGYRISRLKLLCYKARRTSRYFRGNPYRVVVLEPVR
jgi:hypothetical protein